MNSKNLVQKKPKNSESQLFSCNIFYYLLSYVKISFYLFILPFNVCLTKNGNLYFKESRGHQIICFTLHLSSILFGLSTFWNTIYSGPSFSSDDSTAIYQIALVGFISCAAVIFFIDCWFKKSEPTKILLTHAFSFLDSERRDHTTRGKIIMSIFMLWSFLQTINAGYSETKLYFKNVGLEITFLNISEFTNAVRGVYFHLLFHVTILLPFNIATFSMFMIGKIFQEIGNQEYATLALPSPIEQGRSLDKLTDCYMSVKCLTQALNEAFGKQLVIVFLSVLPTLGYGISSIISGSHVPTNELLRTVHIATVFTIMVLLSAQGSSKVTGFAEKAFELMWKSGTLNMKNDEVKQIQILMQYASSSSIGVGGAPFFIITYKLAGTMASALISYTIIMLQFKK